MKYYWLRLIPNIPSFIIFQNILYLFTDLRNGANFCSFWRANLSSNRLLAAPICQSAVSPGPRNRPLWTASCLTTSLSFNRLVFSVFHLKNYSRLINKSRGNYSKYFQEKSTAKLLKNLKINWDRVGVELSGYFLFFSAIVYYSISRKIWVKEFGISRVGTIRK